MYGRSRREKGITGGFSGDAGGGGGTAGGLGSFSASAKLAMGFCSAGAVSPAGEASEVSLDCGSADGTGGGTGGAGSGGGEGRFSEPRTAEGLLSAGGVGGFARGTAGGDSASWNAALGEGPGGSTSGGAGTDSTGAPLPLHVRCRHPSHVTVGSTLPTNPGN